MDDLRSLVDTTMNGPIETLRATCSSAFDFPAGTFIYNAIAIDFFASGRRTSSFVIASSDDSLKWIEVSKEDGQTSLTCVRTHRVAHKGLTCLQMLGDLYTARSSGTSTFMTAGRDGQLKVWTAETGNLLLDFSTPNKQPISAIAALPYVNDKALLAAGTELFDRDPPGDVAVYIWAITNESDPRSAPNYDQPILSITESHTDTISNLFFHVSPASGTATTQPTSEANQKVHLISSSTDGLVNIIDPLVPEEEDAVITVLNNRNAVQYMKASTGTDQSLLVSGQICTISHDEQMSVHVVPEPESEAVRSDPEPIDLRKMLKCDYALGLKEPQGGGRVVLAVGAFKVDTTNQPHVDIYTFSTPPRPSEKPDLELTIRLAGAHGDEIVRDVWFHDSCPFILTCGEDGQVKVWEEDVIKAKPKVEKSEKALRKEARDTRREDRKRKGRERGQDDDSAGGVRLEPYPSKKMAR